MDHRWHDSTWSDRAARGERERFGTATRIERDHDVERRDRLRLAEPVVQWSPWAIGGAWYHQRDLYTRNASIERDGYGAGPSFHPEEGSYAYPRVLHPEAPQAIHASHASLYEREAWPWLNYKEPFEDPYFSFLSQGADVKRQEARTERLQAAPTLWDRWKFRVARALRIRDAKASPEMDRRILLDVEQALLRHHDLDARDIEVDVDRRVVTLKGTVMDRRSKALAKQLALRVLGVADVVDHLTIRRDDSRDAEVAFVMRAALMPI